MHGGAAEPGLLLRALSLPMPGAQAGCGEAPRNRRKTDRQTEPVEREKEKRLKLEGLAQARGRRESGW